MPIISNANHDFSSLSVSTDDSSLDLFFYDIPETETIKGVYFQRAQRLHNIAAFRDVDHNKLALINVGGDCYTFLWSTLEEFPLTRLGQLIHCSSPDDIAQVWRWSSLQNMKSKGRSRIQIQLLPLYMLRPHAPHAPHHQMNQHIGEGGHHCLLSSM